MRGPGRGSAGRGELGARGAEAVPRLWPATPGPLSDVLHCRSGPSVPVRPAAVFSLFISAALFCSYRPSTGRAASPPRGGALGVPQSGAGGLRGMGPVAPRPAPPLSTFSLPPSPLHSLPPLFPSLLASLAPCPRFPHLAASFATFGSGQSVRKKIVCGLVLPGQHYLLETFN